MPNEFKIGNRWVGENHPPLVIAEMGINHGGNLGLAIEIADTAIAAGAEVIKHQTHIVEDEMSDEAKSVIPGHCKESIFEIIDQCSLGEDDEFKLMQHIQSKGVIFISTPFSRAAANRLAKFDVPAYKIGSGECNNYPLIKHIARFGKPIILSTGMNTIETVRPSVEIMRAAKVPFALLHCTNVYPTPNHLVRLDAMKRLQEAFPDAVIGLSDHTTSNYPCLGAVALGARILERHYTDTMSREGPDIVCSMDPKALRELIEGSRIIFEARGDHKGPVAEEDSIIAFAFASVVAIRDLKPGDKLTEDNIWVRRPGGGDFTALDYDKILGMEVVEPIAKDARVKKTAVR